MPPQPPPQNSTPDEPVSPSPAVDPTPRNPQPDGRATPPGGTAGYAYSNRYGAGPASASGGFRTAGGPASGRPPATGPWPGPPAPGYGPAPVPPGYRPSSPTAPTQAVAAGAAGAAGAVTALASALPTAESKKRDLTITKLMAGAGAAATSAVMGSFFGAMGTVGGAALGSVFSAVITSLYQHSLDKTREIAKAKVKLPGGGTVTVSRTTEVPAPRGAAGDQASTRVFVTPGDQPTEVISAVPAVDAGPPKSRRRLLVMAGFTVAVFLIGMLAVTGIELVKGSPLNTSSSSSTSQRSGGTSLGTVLGGSKSTEASTDTGTTSATESAEPTSEATSEDDPSDDEGDNSSAEPRTGFGTDEDESTSESAEVTPAPTRTPRSDTGDQTDPVDQTDGDAAQQGGGAAGPADRQ